MDKMETIINSLDTIMEHCTDIKAILKDGADVKEVDSSIKSRLVFEMFYIKFAIQNIEYYLYKSM